MYFARSLAVYHASISLNTVLVFIGLSNVFLSRGSGVAGRAARTQEQTRAVMHRCVLNLSLFPDDSGN
jgi:hypothetical protein